METERKPKLYLITGHTGAGKSTICKKMRDSLPAFYLSHDQLLVQAYGNLIDTLDFKWCCDQMDGLIWQQAKQLKVFNVDIVLEGYGVRSLRDGVKTSAEQLGYDYELIWVSCPVDERWRRVQHRNEDLKGEGYFTDEADFYRMEEANEELYEDEVATYIDNSTKI